MEKQGQFVHLEKMGSNTFQIPRTSLIYLPIYFTSGQVLLLFKDQVTANIFKIYVFPLTASQM